MHSAHLPTTNFGFHEMSRYLQCVPSTYYEYTYYILLRRGEIFISSANFFPSSPLRSSSMR